MSPMCKHCESGALSELLFIVVFRIRQQAVVGTVAGGNVEPLALNVTLCQVMVTLSLRGCSDVVGQDADWLGPIRAFIREKLSNGSKLSSKHLAALLEVVWRMIVTQRSRGEKVVKDLCCTAYEREVWSLCCVLLYLKRVYVRVCSGDRRTPAGRVCAVPAEEPWCDCPYTAAELFQPTLHSRTSEPPSYCQVHTFIK